MLIFYYLFFLPIIKWYLSFLKLSEVYIDAQINPTDIFRLKWKAMKKLPLL